MTSWLDIVENVAFVLPAMPRLLSALTEWAACVVVALLVRRRFRAPQTAGVLAAALVAQVILRCCWTSIPTTGAFLGIMVANLALMGLVIALVCELKATAVALCWTLAFMLAEVEASLAWEFASYAFPAPTMTDPAVLAFLLAFIAAFSFLAYLCLRNFEPALGSCDASTMTLALAVAFLTFLASNVYVVFNNAVWQSPSSADVPYIVGWLRALADACGLALLLMILAASMQRAAQAEMAQLHATMDAQYDQYLQFRETSAYIAQQSHDLRHQVQALKESCSEAERESYLADLEEAVDDYSAHVATNNSVLDTLINQKLLYCRRRGINLSYVGDATALDRMEARDVCVVFGNLLENAIESVQDIEDPERRQIVLELTQKSSLFGIRIDNCCDKDVAFLNGLPTTTKSDRRVHGFGMRGVQSVVNKYDGSMECSLNDGWFVTSILLPLAA